MLLIACTAQPESDAPHGEIRLMRVGAETSRVEPLDRNTSIDNPSFMIRSRKSGFFYVASERDGKLGLISQFGIGADRIKVMSTITSGGIAPVHLCFDRSERFILVANYTQNRAEDSASIACVSLDQRGQLGDIVSRATHRGSGPDPIRQKGPHCHGVAMSPDNRLAVAVDLGTDSLFFYNFDPQGGRLSPREQLRLPAGTGPRHAAFHPTLPALYVTGELSSTLLVVELPTAGRPAHVAKVLETTRKRGKARNYPSGLVVTNDGHHVLVANRGANTIACFYVDPGGGGLLPSSETGCGGGIPRSIRTDEAGRFLTVANQKSGIIAIFSWSMADAALTLQDQVDAGMHAPYDALTVDQ